MRFRVQSGALALIAGLGLSGCVGDTFQRGYVPSEAALQQIKVGSSRDQVIIALGTPSTSADFGGEVFYYISQTTKRPVAFMGTHVTDQKVLAVYFDEGKRVKQVANYGLKDGRIFDSVSRTTPTGGSDFSFLSQIFMAAGNFNPVQSGP